MRARGAKITDIVVLVVAADDGVMPQTVEALDHAKAAGVPIIVAVNKVDKEEADPVRVRTQMVELGIVPSEYGGTFEFVDVSAKTKVGLDTLLETILLVADLEELKGDPTGHARGAVIEAHLDKGRGPIATVLVQKGTLSAGDALICGTAYAKIRAMQDENGLSLIHAGLSKPVQILGWSHVPSAGDDFREVDDEREARHIASEREAKMRSAELVISRPPTLSDLMRQAERAEVPELNLIVKADVQGSLGALSDALLKLPQEEVRVNIVRAAAGGITEDDISLALASDCIVIGFNVRPDKQARELAEKEGVDVRLYRVIYDAIDDIKAALSGMLKPEQREKHLGTAEVRAMFRVPKLGVIAGCYVTQGTITRDGRVRLVRDSVVVYDGKVASLRRFKDDVRRGGRAATSAASASRTSRTSRKATSSRPTRSARWPAPSEPMLVALQRFDLRIPGCGSLKQKRHVVKSLTGAIRSTFNVSVAEVDHHDLWQRTTIAVAATGAEELPRPQGHAAGGAIRRGVGGAWRSSRPRSRSIIRRMRRDYRPAPVRLGACRRDRGSIASARSSARSWPRRSRS